MPSFPNPQVLPQHLPGHAVLFHSPLPLGLEAGELEALEETPKLAPGIPSWLKGRG